MGKKKAPTRKSSRGLRGNSHSKQVKSLVLFAVEGATEKEYLKALNQHRYRGAFALDFCGSGSSSESSLKNLLVNVKRKASDLGSDNVSGAWIVCDVDENQPHAENLEKWLTEQSRLSRGVVLSNPCIEAWFVYHCANTCSSRTAGSALKELQNKWKQGTYAKGMVIPEWLIDHTDEACLRVQRRRASFAQGVTAWDEAPWSDMPELIAWLDQLKPRRSA